MRTTAAIARIFVMYVMFTFLILLTLTSACQDPPLCDPELKFKKSYAVVIDEIYNSSSSTKFDSRYTALGYGSSPSCNGFDGLTSNSSIKIQTTTREQDGVCDDLSGDILILPNGLNWGPGANRTAGGFAYCEIFYAIGKLMTGTCTGNYQIDLCRPMLYSSIFEYSSKGNLPNLVLGRSFQPDEGSIGSGCFQCTDTFVARMNELN